MSFISGPICRCHLNFTYVIHSTRRGRERERVKHFYPPEFVNKLRAHTCRYTTIHIIQLSLQLWISLEPKTTTVIPLNCIVFFSFFYIKKGKIEINSIDCIFSEEKNFEKNNNTRTYMVGSHLNVRQVGSLNFSRTYFIHRTCPSDFLKGKFIEF